MTHLSVDFETRSTVDLKKTGVYPYAAHFTTEILCMAWALGDDEPEIWVPGMSVPYPVLDHVYRGGEIHAWNAQFERVIWWLLLYYRYGFPRPDREQFVDTAAAAAAMALPRGLGDAAKALGLPFEKDDEGRRLMLQMTKPRKARKGEDPSVVYWHDDDERRARLAEYCKQDVRVERAVGALLRPLSDYERGIYLLDQKMNDRGVPIDRELVTAAQRIVKTGMIRANEEIDRLTGGVVGSVTKVADLTGWLQEVAGLDVDDVRKDTLRDLLAEGDMDDTARRVVELRSESAKSSTAKLTSMAHVMGVDDRARGLLLYHGASTGRWSGKLIQPQNFPRGTVKGVERFIPAVLAGDYDAIAAEAPPLVVISSMLRSMIRASPGHVLTAGDFAQIEARIVAWIAGQEDLVDLFAAGGKIYETMAAAIYGLPVDDIAKDSVERQIGKNTVLGCGFQMGWRTFQAQVKVQTGIDISDEDAERAVGAYRETYSRIKFFWYDIEKAAIRATLNEGAIARVGRNAKIGFVVRGQFLWCILPSGRPLAYALPRVGEKRTPWGEMKPQLTFMGVHPGFRKWMRIPTYGGHLTENVVQGMARDLIAGAMVRVEDAGYRPILTVHDEVLAEHPEEHGSLDEFLELMRRRPRWAEGLPVAADGWRGERYRK